MKSYDIEVRSRKSYELTGNTIVPNFVLTTRRLSRQAKLIYTILSMYRFGKDNCFPSQKTLAELMGYKTDDSIRAYLAELETAGLITKETQATPTGKRCIYWFEDERTCKLYEQESQPEKNRGSEDNPEKNRVPHPEKNRVGTPKHFGVKKEKQVNKKNTEEAKPKNAAIKKIKCAKETGEWGNITHDDLADYFSDVIFPKHYGKAFLGAYTLRWYNYFSTFLKTYEISISEVLPVLERLSPQYDAELKTDTQPTVTVWIFSQQWLLDEIIPSILEAVRRQPAQVDLAPPDKENMVSF